MPAEVLYRKWRPQRFADVAGQAVVTRTLINALTSNRVSHAYLFSGPRGTGKTTTARLLAKAVNCEKNAADAKKRAGEPCNAVPILQGLRRRQRARPRRAGRREQPRHRRHPRPARERQLHADGRRRGAQGLPHRRSAHAHGARVQRAAQDPRRAARAHRLHPGDDGHAQGARHHRLALPALRVQAHRRSRRWRTASRRSRRRRRSMSRAKASR